MSESAPEPTSESDRIDLEPSSGKPIRPDLRPPIFVPPPVRVIAVNDVHLPAAVGREAELIAFYVEVLSFSRVTLADGTLAFVGENVSLVFDLEEPPLNRENLAPTVLEVLSLRALRESLFDREIAFETMHGLMPGTEHVVVRDPGGNLLAIGGWTLFS